MSSDDLHRHRMALISLRAELREVQRYRADREAVLALSAEGKNESERKAKLAVALANDDQHVRLTEDAERLQSTIDEHEAEIEHLRDLRRDWEWNIRLRLAAALDGRGLPAERHPDEAFDTAPDAAALGAVVDAAQTAIDEAFVPKYEPPPPRRNRPVPVLDEIDLPF